MHEYRGVLRYTVVLNHGTETALLTLTLAKLTS